MTVTQLNASGKEALTLATRLLQRATHASPKLGIWEAADVQWWWRSLRLSDQAPRLFWLDEEGPAAGVLVTSWSEDLWQCDPIVVPGTSTIDQAELWQRATDHMASLTHARFDVPIRDDDHIFQGLARQSGLSVSGRDGTAWMDGADRPAVSALAEGFSIVDRSQRRHVPHPMIRRNGGDVVTRLAECSLYDPALDLAVETVDGRVAGYALFWFDAITGTGLVEPVRVEDEFQRLGLGRAMLTTGIDRLVKKGARRIKVSYETDAASRLYTVVGFRQESTTSWYRSPAR